MVVQWSRNKNRKYVSVDNMIIDNVSEKIRCTRCGVCCSSGVCSHGVDDDRGLCAYLLINGHTDKHRTSCRLILDHKVNLVDIGVGKGCLLRHVPHAYTYYLEQMKRKIEYIKKECING